MFVHGGFFVFSSWFASYDLAALVELFLAYLVVNKSIFLHDQFLPQKQVNTIYLNNNGVFI